MATPASEHGGGFPPFESHTFASQLIWLALAFGLLYYLMDKIALPRIQAILHDRATRLSSDLDEAQRLKAEADAAGAAYEKSLSDAQAKAQAIALETHTALTQEAETQAQGPRGRAERPHRRLRGHPAHPHDGGHGQRPRHRRRDRLGHRRAP